MKIIYLILTTLLTSMVLPSSAQSKGVNFLNISYHEALEQALVSRKCVFVDCYTSWCVPCRYMLNTVFNNQEAAYLINSKTIPVKFDMEKGEGVELAKTYGIKAYPTFLILSAKGEVLYKIVGGNHWPMFKEKLLRALNPKNQCPYLEKRYKSGKIANRELLAYWQLLKDGEWPEELRDRVRIKLENNLKGMERFDKDYWSLYEDKNYDTEAFKFVLNHFERFKKSVGEDIVEDYLKEKISYMMVYCKYSRKDQDKKTLLLIKQEVEPLSISGKDTLMDELAYSLACVEEDIDEMITLIENKFLNATEEKIWAVVSPLSDFGKKIATPRQMERIRALESKIKACQSNEEFKKRLESFFERFL